MDKSLKPSEKEALIAFIKANKKKFYKGLWKWYPFMNVATDLIGTMSSPIKTILSRDPGNYQYAAEVNVIDKVLMNDLWDQRKKYGFGIGPKELNFIHRKIWHRFEKYYYLAPKRKHLPRPFMKKTTAIKEFLFRGFIHKDDAIDFRGKKYIIESTIAPLVWPEGFDTHSEACEQSAKVGIPGYTKCPIPS